MLERRLSLPASGKETFFLWEARQTGKSTLLRRSYPDAIWIDLLKAEEFRRYLEHASPYFCFLAASIQRAKTCGRR